MSKRAAATSRVGAAMGRLGAAIATRVATAIEAARAAVATAQNELDATPEHEFQAKELAKKASTPIKCLAADDTSPVANRENKSPALKQPGIKKARHTGQSMGAAFAVAMGVVSDRSISAGAKPVAPNQAAGGKRTESDRLPAKNGQARVRISPATALLIPALPAAVVTQGMSDRVAAFHRRDKAPLGSVAATKLEILSKASAALKPSGSRPSTRALHYRP